MKTNHDLSRAHQGTPDPAPAANTEASARSPIDIYLTNLPTSHREALQQLRRTIKALVPEATERISTRVPAFYYKGKYLVSFSAARNHLALLVMHGDIVKSLAEELRPYDTGSRIIRFTPEEPLPDGLVRRIVYLRKAQIDGDPSGGERTTSAVDLT